MFRPYFGNKYLNEKQRHGTNKNRQISKKQRQSGCEIKILDYKEISLLKQCLDLLFDSS